ncbi:MAG: STAS domain-containing protein [Anaerolineales bacterium]|nr:STAS domain-containing protein [Anaerolineales bacterium]
MKLESYTSGTVKILKLSGRFETHTAPQVRQWFDETTLLKPASLVVNMEEVSFIDSTGLSSLIHGMKRAREMNGDLRLCGLRQSVRMILELTRLDKVFEIFISEDEAVHSFSI